MIDLVLNLVAVILWVLCIIVAFAYGRTDGKTQVIERVCTLLEARQDCITVADVLDAIDMKKRSR